MSVHDVRELGKAINTEFGRIFEFTSLNPKFINVGSRADAADADLLSVGLTKILDNLKKIHKLPP